MKHWFSTRIAPALAALGLAAGLAATASTVQAQAYPSKVVTMVVPFGPGNAYDVMARTLAERLRELSGQPFIVEPRQGAIGNVAAASVARSPADGYTIFFTANSTHAANIHLFKQLPYDPVADFEPVTTIATIPQILLVSPTVPAKTLAELIAMAKREPGKLNYGSASATGRVASESFRQATGIDAVHVPYKTTAQMITDLVSGQLHFMVADAGSAVAHVQGGRARALAATSKQRLAAVPDVPTMAESGFPDFEFVAWLAMFVPAKTPQPVIARLSDLINQVVRSPGYQETLAKVYAQPYPGTPDSLRQLAARDTERWGKMIKAAGIQPQ